MSTAVPVAGSVKPSVSSGTMRALFKHHAGVGLKFDANRPKPVCGPRDVMIRVSKAGICGTDRHIWEWDDWSAGRIPVGIVTGHEFVGIIEQVGSAVTRYKPGLRVSAEGHITAGSDYNSRTGNAHIASDTRIIGIDRDGCFAEYVCVPEENVWPVHPSIPDKVAAVLDPLGNAVHTVMAAGVSAKSVLITGVGIIGLMAVTVAKAAGAGRIFVTDINPKRLELAKRLGAVGAFNGREGDGWVKDVKKACRGEGVDVLLEMSGSPAAYDQGFAALRNGGTAALLGIPAKPPTFNITQHVVFKGATVLGINGRKMFETWYQMEELLVSGKLELDEIITHEFPLEQFETAFETMISGEGIKVVMNVNG
ncbi:MAG: L-threonine 3-dehydrogenase [Planctomycetota bacterium]|nr:L-threonine 3-dehydrogenase [Planctomycetota bacterium]